MQKIKHEYQNIHPIFDDIEKFYYRVSSTRSNRALISDTFDLSFQELQFLFNHFADTNYQFNLVEKEYQRINLPKFDKKNIIVCFSGGKDSIAAVLHYQKLGYNVYLYHVRHINFALSDEWEVVQKFAEEMQLPLYIDTITLSGHHDYVEHPMKNMIIANGALNYGIREKISTKIAFGNYYTSSILDDNFTFCGGDDIETWKAYEKIIQRVIPKFRMYICLKNLGTTLNSIGQDLKLLNLSVSCIGRANLRAYKRSWVRKKYGISLPQHRCGQCYKCCVEYIYLTDHDLIEFSEDYYKYCLKKLQKNSEKETGIEYSLTSVWNRYFFYDRDKSKLVWG